MDRLLKLKITGRAAEREREKEGDGEGERERERNANRLVRQTRCSFTSSRRSTILDSKVELLARVPPPLGKYLP